FVLLGALLASNLRYWAHDIAPGPVPEPADRFADALAIVRLLAERAPEGPGHALPAHTWRAVFDDDSARAERAVRLAASCGYVERMAAVEPVAEPQGDPVWAEYWSLAMPASRLTLAKLFAGVWGGPLAGVHAPGLDLSLDRWVATVPRGPSRPLPTDSGGDSAGHCQVRGPCTGRPEALREQEVAQRGQHLVRLLAHHGVAAVRYDDSRGLDALLPPGDGGGEFAGRLRRRHHVTFTQHEEHRAADRGGGLE